jgi:hypothetical protein
MDCLWISYTKIVVLLNHINSFLFPIISYKYYEISYMNSIKSIPSGMSPLSKWSKNTNLLATSILFLTYKLTHEFLNQDIYYLFIS